MNETATRIVNFLIDIWNRETAHMSNMSQVAKHPACKALQGMGEDAHPRLMEIIDGYPHLVMVALWQRVEIPEEDRGNVKKMIEHYKNWWKTQVE